MQHFLHCLKTWAGNYWHAGSTQRNAKCQQMGPIMWEKAQHEHSISRITLAEMLCMALPACCLLNEIWLSFLTLFVCFRHRLVFASTFNYFTPFVPESWQTVKSNCSFGKTTQSVLLWVWPHARGLNSRATWRILSDSVGMSLYGW